jgi:acetyltransferase-like isoleucine patch superfamily enzyme
MGFSTFLRWLRTANQASLLRSLRLAFRTRSLEPRIWVYPDVHVSLGRDAAFAGPGSLHVGRRWRGRRYLQSELVLGDRARLELRGDFSIHTGCSVAVNDGAHLVLGSGYINHRASIECFQQIAIGDGVAIAKGVTIRDSDAHSINGNSQVSAPISIGNRVWIGANAIILKGVTIGEGSVVAAGAVVTRDVPPRSLVAGMPARVLKTEVTWS